MSSSQDAREELYAEIVAIAKAGLSRFYLEYPELIGDDRSKEALAWSMRGVRRILEACDKYEIQRRTHRLANGREPRDAPDSK